VHEDGGALLAEPRQVLIVAPQRACDSLFPASQGLDADPHGASSLGLRAHDAGHGAAS
jgi:hypothetical protein